jgi:hypothetical protein
MIFVLAKWCFSSISDATLEFRFAWCLKKRALWMCSGSSYVFVSQFVLLPKSRRICPLQLHPIRPTTRTRSEAWITGRQLLVSHKVCAVFLPVWGSWRRTQNNHHLIRLKFAVGARENHTDGLGIFSSACSVHITRLRCSRILLGSLSLYGALTCSNQLLGRRKTSDYSNKDLGAAVPARLFSLPCAECHEVMRNALNRGNEDKQLYQILTRALDLSLRPIKYTAPGARCGLARV